MSINWEQQSAGRYTSEVGQIERQADGWCVFPKALVPHAGPFKTLKEAKEKASLISSTHQPTPQGRIMCKRERQQCTCPDCDCPHKTVAPASTEGK